MLLGHLVIFVNGLLLNTFEDLKLVLVEPIQPRPMDREDPSQGTCHGLATGDHSIVEE